jgi:hypothetical protein
MHSRPPPLTLGNLLCRPVNGLWVMPRLRSKLEDVIAQDVAFEKIGTRTAMVNGRRIPSGPKTSRFVPMQIEEAAPTAVTGDRTGGRMRY